MKKSTKLLSVLLAVIMILSTLTVAASAAKTSYKTVANLESLSAYNNYGTVTRLSTEERMSIIFDELDRILAKANINMGTVFDTLGLTVTLDFRSIDKICSSLDTIYNTFNSGLASIAMAILNFGIIESVNFDSWKTGMTRAGQTQLTIIYEVLELLKNNSSVVNTVLTDGLDLGMIGGMITGLDLSEINAIVTDLPTFIRSKVYPLMSRPDDTATLRDRYQTATYSIYSTVNDFVKGLFTKRMNWTSYREDAAGNYLAQDPNDSHTYYTVALPTTNSTTRYFEKNGNTITQYDYQFDGDDKGTWTETVTYTKTIEFEGASTYVYKAPEGYEGDGTLKWYTGGDHGYWVKGLKEGFDNNTLTIDLNGTDTVLGLLYKFAPVIFSEMVPVVMNGSVKKLVAELFDVKFTKLGDKGEFTAPVADTFFTEDQGYYIWEYSNYKVIDGVPYYRFQDEFFVGEVPANISSYYYMFDWNYQITGDFLDEFVPASDGATSTAGYTRILQGLNKFVGKLIDLVIADSWTIPKTGETYTKDSIFTWTDGDNSKLLNNILGVARNVVSIAPVEIFGDYYAEAQFYNAMMTGTLSQAVNGAICEGVKLLMPQIIFPDNIVDQNMLAIAAVVVRELCSQLMPSYNFDALIYSDYNNRAVITGKDKEYWLNTTITMGMDLGMYYLRNLADLGEDTASSYYTVMKNLGATPTTDAEAMTYTSSFDVSKWTYKVDWILDWALATDEWCWRMGKLVNVTGATTLTSYQDPWAKLNTVLLSLLPFDQLLNVSGATSSTFLEKVLRDKLVYSIADLDVPNLVSLFDIPSGYFRNTKILDQAVKLVVGIVNGVASKAYGGELLTSSTYTTVTALLTHSNLRTTVKNLVANILAFVYTNGVLDVALPFVNMFLGWKTDPQEFKDPEMYWFNDGGDTYLYSGVTNTLRFVNNSSGMLLKHRNANADQPYNITVKGVNFGTSGITTTQSFPVTCGPYDTLDIALSVPSANKAFKVTVTYAFTGKDGAALGGDQTKVYYGYIASNQDQEHVKVDAVDTGDYWQRNEYESYVFTRDIYDSVTHYQGSASYKAATIQIGNKTKNFQSVKYDTTPGAPMSTYFNLITDRATAGWVSALVKDSVTNTSGNFWAAKSGVTAATDFPYGTYDGGTIALKYGSKSGTWTIDFIYYNDFEVGSVMSKYMDMGLQASDVSGEGQSYFTAYENALLNVVKWACIPKRTDYVTSVQPNIEAAITALDTAYEALEPYITKEAVNYESNLQTILDTCEDRDRDYDFQDYKLFEYFKYETQRTNLRNMLHAYEAPVAPTKYIENEDLTLDQINDIIAAQTLQSIKTGIQATLLDPSQDSLDAYAAAAAEWSMPTYSELEVADTIAKLPYYKSFMIANPRPAYYNQFLAKEVAYADANFPASDEALYSPDSWAEYSTRLATAKAVLNNANALHSEIFDAKYFLMVAMNDLNVVEHSMKDDGNNYLAELQNLIANAETILAHQNLYTVVAGVTEAEALGQLVSALGVRYTNDNGDDAILYDHSAYTFVDYDRVNTTKEKGKVDNAADKLKAAIDNFYVKTIDAIANDEIITQIDQRINTIQGVKPGAILSGDMLLAHVDKLIATADYAPAPSKAGAYGTGSTITVTVPSIGVEQIYYVVIYGDINGDNAIDAFDMLASDRAINKLDNLRMAYKMAADIDSDGDVVLADYTAVKNAVNGSAPIAGNG